MFSQRKRYVVDDEDMFALKLRDGVLALPVMIPTHTPLNDLNLFWRKGPDMNYKKQFMNYHT